jgi:hypothetical protein
MIAAGEIAGFDPQKAGLTFFRLREEKSIRLNHPALPQTPLLVPKGFMKFLTLETRQPKPSNNFCQVWTHSGFSRIASAPKKDQPLV